MHAPGSPWQFFLLAIAYSIGWNAVSSELARFAAEYGSDALLHLSLAFYIPSVPLLLAAATLDGWFDARFGRYRAHMFRAVAGFGGCTAILAAFPFLQGSLAQVLCGVTALGVASSVAFACSYQLAGGCGPEATVALTLGFVASAPAVLAIEAALRLGPECSWLQMFLLYVAAASVAASGLVAAVALARRRRSWSRRRLYSGASGEQQQTGGAAAGPPQLHEPLLLPSPLPYAAAAAAAEEAGGRAVLAVGVGALLLQRQLSPAAAVAAAAAADEEDVDGGSVYLEEVALLPDGSSPPLRAVWPAAASLFLSVAASMFLFPLLTHFPCRQLGAMLPVVLFWTRCFSDIAGRLLPRAWPGAPPGAAALLALAALRVSALPLALAYIWGRLPDFLYSDWLLVGYVSCMWLSAGALNVWAYLSLPRLVAPALLSRATSAMTLTFNTACLAGLLLAIPFSSLGSTVQCSVPSSRPP